MFNLDKQKEERERIQNKAENIYKESNGRGCFLIAPRVGKTRLCLNCVKYKEAKKVLVLYPRHDIKEGWIKEMDEIDYHPEIEFSTFKSIMKIVDNTYDFIIIDEPQELSGNNILQLNEFLNRHENVLAVTGTLIDRKQWNLKKDFSLPVLFEYTIEEAVKDGILTDYTIYIHKISLDPVEGKKFNQIEFLERKLRKEGKNAYFLELKKLSIIQNSTAKLKKTKELIEKYKEDRLLIFCGVTEIANSLGIEVYHSKKKEEPIIRAFCNGEILHLATLNMVQAGVTIKPIHKGIINYISGASESATQKISRLLGFEYSTPDKKAEIHIIIATNFEKNRLNISLQWFDKDKIIFL